MKSLLILLIAAVFVLASDVIELDSNNFDQVIKENNLILVEFYAPWCGHCKKLAPEYEKAATELKGIAPIAKINADEESNRPLSGLYGIRGFPTLKVFRKNGEVISDYEGERSASAIVSFMKRQSRPAVSTVSSAEEVTTLSGQDKVVIVGFFDDETSEEVSKFRQVADLLRNKFLFGELIGKADVAKSFGLESTPGVILFKSFDERKNVLSKDQFAELETFISTYSVPLVDEIGPENYRTYAESPLPLVYLFVDLSVEGQKDTYLDVVNGIAQETKGKLNWVYIDWSKYARHAESLGLSGKTVPAMAIEEMKEGLHYAFDEKQEITKESISEWTNQFLNKQLQPTIKSEEVPESNDGPVKILVAKNFDQIVYDNTKDVLVEFYAPWCGHCKKLAPTFEELGKAFQDQPNVVIAKIDATANDINKKHGVRGFPTLKFFPAGDKENPIDYNGDRSLEDLKTFISGQTSKTNDSTHQKDEL